MSTPFNRRLWGTSLLEGVLMIITLYLGWFIWLFFTAKTGQTPAKRLLNVYTLDARTGQVTSAGRVWLRDVVVETLLFAWIGGVFTAGIASLIDGAFVLFDKNRQSLHDKIVDTIVVYAPRGLPEALQAPSQATPVSGVGVRGLAEELRELARLREEGILTDEEYEAKRRHLAEQL